MEFGRSALLEIMRSGELGAAPVADVREAIRRDLAERLPKQELSIRGAVTGPVEILRDPLGIPRISAQSSADLFFGLGFALAQDRLWQMDMLRRRGLGRLSEVAGAGSLSSDVQHRTIGSDRHAEADAAAMSETAHDVLEAFTAGINRLVELQIGNLPIEFDLLGYEPEPWRPIDVLAAVRGFWWQLNGRLASIVAGEACLRTLQESRLLDVAMTPEFPEETIVPGGASIASNLQAGSDSGLTGSNNWAVSGALTASGGGVMGSDPHLPFGLPSTWYECHLVGPDDDVMGAIFAGAPGVILGRNRTLAWGFTNNNTSLRDLYIEEVDASGDAYLDGDRWTPFATRTVDISVAGREPERLVIRESSRGPIVNHLLSPVDPNGDPPLSMRWVGQQPIDSVGALIAMNRAGDWEEFRSALRSWVLPTFNWIVAGENGSARYQCTAAIPVRGRVTRGYRKANEPNDAWTGFAAFDAMPRVDNPATGYVISANNRTAPVDFPVPIYGAFAAGDRARRIREMLAEVDAFDRAACRRLQLDTFSPFAERLTKLVASALAGSADPDVAAFLEILNGWDFHYERDSRPPVVFEMFRQRWFTCVYAERFPEHLLPVVTGMGSAATAVLEDPSLGWFAEDARAILERCVKESFAAVQERYGPESKGWRWGDIHAAHFRHPLSNGVTAALFDVGPEGVSGGVSTVRNTGLGATFESTSGAELQVVADMGEEFALSVCQNLGQSGQPGSPHYEDQFRSWIAGEYHEIVGDRGRLDGSASGFVRIAPQA